MLTYLVHARLSRRYPGAVALDLDRELIHRRAGCLDLGLPVGKLKRLRRHRALECLEGGDLEHVDRQKQRQRLLLSVRKVSLGLL